MNYNKLKKKKIRLISLEIKKILTINKAKKVLLSINNNKKREALKKVYKKVMIRKIKI